VVDKDGSAPLCRLAPRCSPLREVPLARLPATAARGSLAHPSRSPAPAARLQATSERLRQVLVGDKDGSTPLCRLAPRCSPLREAIVDLRAFAVRAAAGRQARCGGPRGAKLAPAAHIFDVCVVYTVCTPAPVPSVPTREALMPVFAPCPDWLGGGSRLACNRSCASFCSATATTPPGSPRPTLRRPLSKAAKGRLVAEAGVAGG